MYIYNHIYITYRCPYRFPQWMSHDQARGPIHRQQGQDQVIVATPRRGGAKDGAALLVAVCGVRTVLQQDLSNLRVGWEVGWEMLMETQILLHKENVMV